MKKLVIILVVVLGLIGMASAQSKSIYSGLPQVNSSIYSTPKVTNYNTTYKSNDSYRSNQTYRTPRSYTTVSTTRTSLGNNNYMSGTNVYSNGTRRSSSKTTSLDLGTCRMTTTQYFNNNGSMKKSHTKTTMYGR